jgi:Protein of unknown function (DUF2934)
MDHLEQAVRERAYFIWLDGGCGHGSADEHWLAAEAELTSEAEVLAASMETVARLMIFSETAQDNEPAVGKSTAKRLAFSKRSGSGHVRSPLRAKTKKRVADMPMVLN